MSAIVLAGLQQLANDGGEITQVVAKQGFLEALFFSRKISCIRILTLNELVVLHWEAQKKEQLICYSTTLLGIYFSKSHLFSQRILLKLARIDLKPIATVS